MRKAIMIILILTLPVGQGALAGDLAVDNGNSSEVESNFTINVNTGGNKGDSVKAGSATVKLKETTTINGRTVSETDEDLTGDGNDSIDFKYEQTVKSNGKETLVENRSELNGQVESETKILRDDGIKDPVMNALGGNDSDSGANNAPEESIEADINDDNNIKINYKPASDEPENAIVVWWRSFFHKLKDIFSFWV